MGYKIACWTLFDITHTGVPNRSTPPADVIAEDWIKQRNTQCNYDTIMQIVSLRGLPEIVEQPQRQRITKDNKKYFGVGYKFGRNDVCWMFTFYIQSISVFDNGVQELGTLFVDSNDVPMILTGTGHRELLPTLNTISELKNIHYEVISHEYEPNT